MKKGFTPLEVMLALAVGLLIGGVLLQTVSQLTTSLNKINSVSYFDTRIAIVQNLLEKELAGAFVPELTMLKQSEQSAVQEDLEKTENSNDQKKGVASKHATDNKKTQIVRPAKAFYSENEGDIFRLLTFITTNPLEVYGTSKPRAARVIYRLLPDERDPELFALYRQETATLINPEKLLDHEGAAKGFVVIDGIVSIKTEFFAYAKEPESKKNQEDSAERKQMNNSEQQQNRPHKKEEKKLLTFERWDVEKQDSASAEKKEQSDKLPPLPTFIKMKIILSDDRRRERAFECYFAPCYGYQSILLSGIKPLPAAQQSAQKEPKTQGKTDDHAVVEKKIDSIMKTAPMSHGLKEKLGQLGDNSQQSAQGPIARGMQQ